MREDEASGPTPIHADMSAFASILSPAGSVARVLPTGIRRAYVHLSMSKYRVPRQPIKGQASRVTVEVEGGASATLEEGDGLYIDVKGEEATLKLSNEGEADAEFILFEMTS